MICKKLIEQYKELEEKYMKTPLGNEEASELLNRLHEMELKGMENAIHSLIENFELNSFCYKDELEKAQGDWDRLESLVREVIKDGVVKMCTGYGFKMSDCFGLSVECSLSGVEKLLNEVFQIRVNKDLFFGKMSYLAKYSFIRKKYDDGDWIRESDDIKFCLDIEKEE
jgi:hypothetical protein